MTLSKFSELLKSAGSLKQLNKFLMQYLSEFGIKTFSYTYYSYHPNSQNKLKYDLASADFLVWHQHYLSENYQDIDSTLEAVYRTTTPIFWDLQQQLAQAQSPEERKMRLDSIAFGATKGLSIPIHGPDEDFSILLLVQMQGQSCLEQWQELQYELFAAAYCYYSYLKSHLPKAKKEKNKYQLTEREIQCLTLIAKEYSMQTIAQILKITIRTVNYYTQRINKKLGTKNKYQSVLRALQKKLIDL